MKRKEKNELKNKIKFKFNKAHISDGCRSNFWHAIHQHLKADVNMNSCTDSSSLVQYIYLLEKILLTDEKGKLNLLFSSQSDLSLYRCLQLQRKR